MIYYPRSHFQNRFLQVLFSMILMLLMICPSSVAQSSDREPPEHTESSFNRYILSTNAIGTPQGRFIFNNNLVLLNSLSYGITNHFSVSGGFIPLFLSKEPTPVFIKSELKAPLNLELFHMSIGAYLGTTIGGNHLLYGSTFAKATIGNPSYNLSLSLMHLYNNHRTFNFSFYERRSNALMGINAHVRVYKSFSFVTENFFAVKGSTDLISITALRIYPGIAFIDLGLIMSTPKDSFDVDVAHMPYIGISVIL